MRRLGESTFIYATARRGRSITLRNCRGHPALRGPLKSPGKGYWKSRIPEMMKRTIHPSEIALETPAFATLEKGEIDFFVKSLLSGNTYAVEVKAGKNSGKTAAEALEKEKARIIAIPIYGIAKYQ